MYSDSGGVPAVLWHMYVSKVRKPSGAFAFVSLLDVSAGTVVRLRARVCARVCVSVRACVLSVCVRAARACACVCA